MKDTTQTIKRNWLKLYCCSLCLTLANKGRRLRWYVLDGLQELLSGAFRIATAPLLFLWFCLIPLLQVIAVIRHRRKINWKRIEDSTWTGKERNQ